MAISVARVSLLTTISIFAYIFTASTFISGPVCSRIYGQPDPEACQQLLKFRSGVPDVPQGIAWTDVANHCFSLAHTTRPANCTPTQWQERVNRPRFWSNAGCKAALLPLRLFSGEIGYDYDDWRHIANIGSNIQLICMTSKLFDGVNAVPLGGYRSAGNNKQLVFVLYAHYSVYDQEVLADDPPVVAVESAEGFPNPADPVNLPAPNASGRETIAPGTPPAPPKPNGPLCGSALWGSGPSLRWERWLHVYRGSVAGDGEQILYWVLQASILVAEEWEWERLERGRLQFDEPVEFFGFSTPPGTELGEYDCNGMSMQLHLCFGSVLLL